MRGLMRVEYELMQAGLRNDPCGNCGGWWANAEEIAAWDRLVAQGRARESIEACPTCRQDCDCYIVSPNGVAAMMIYEALQAVVTP
jgi:hypothetical protein